MIIAYYRVSTARQGNSGLGLEAQRAAVEDHAERTHEPIVASYTEVESGRRCDRPKLAAAIAHARAARAVLVVAKLDRLARDAGFLLSLVDSGVRLRFLDLPDISTDPITGRLVLTVMAAMAEFEARRIAQRCRESAARRKVRGDAMGWKGTRGQRNPLTNAHRRIGSTVGGLVRSQRSREFRAVVEPLARQFREAGLSQREIAGELNARGFTTQRGKPWDSSRVNILFRKRESQ